VELSSRSVPTLQEYLSKLYCTGCSKRCPLTALRCSRGTRYKNAAVAQYNSLYGENSSNKGSTSPAATPGPGSASNSGFGSNSGTGSASGPQNTPIDFIAIMGLFVAGTHYTVTIPKNLSHALRAVPASD
jgi:hypothetical protein